MDDHDLTRLARILEGLQEIEETTDLILAGDLTIDINGYVITIRCDHTSNRVTNIS